MDSSAITESLNKSNSEISISSTFDENIESDTREYETENDETNAGACGVDALYIAKNKMQWSANPLPRQFGASAENIISLPLGPTRFAVSSCRSNSCWGLSVHKMFLIFCIHELVITIILYYRGKNEDLLVCFI